MPRIPPNRRQIRKRRLTRQQRVAVTLNIRRHKKRRIAKGA